MIKFTDETIRDAQYKSDCIDNQYRDGIRNSTRAAAAVFEAAASKQADAELLSPDDVRGILGPKGLPEEGERAQANTRDFAPAAPRDAVARGAGATGGGNGVRQSFFLAHWLEETQFDVPLSLKVTLVAPPVIGAPTSVSEVVLTSSDQKFMEFVRGIKSGTNPELVMTLSRADEPNTRDCVGAYVANLLGNGPAPYAEKDGVVSWTGDASAHIGMDRDDILATFDKARIDAISPTPEPFQVGKRYRTRACGIARIISVGDRIVAQYEDGAELECKLDGTHAIDGLLGSHRFPRDLLPGAVDDELAESPLDDKGHQRFMAGYDAGLKDGIALERRSPPTPEPPAESAGGMTDEYFAGLLHDAWASARSEDEGWLAAALCAREKIGRDITHWQRRAAQAEVELALSKVGTEPSELIGQIAIAGRAGHVQPQNKHNETYECVIADLTRQVRDANSRAERAEAAIERMSEGVAMRLRMHAESKSEHDAGTFAYTQYCDRIDELEALASLVGLTITPARELTVTWEGGK
jgi:hypothetical protein